MKFSVDTLLGLAKQCRARIVAHKIKRLTEV